MKELKIGVIGVCGRGVIADLAHRPEEGVRVVAGADLSEESLSEFDKRLGGGMALYTDYREMLKDGSIGAVFITAPDFLHEEMAVAALESGKAVYLEKPMAISIEGCDRILATAYRTGSKLYLGHNMRYYPSVHKMKELVDSGAIGTLQAVWCRHFINYGGDAYFKDWHSERKNVNGLLLQKGAHDIDVIHYVAGGYTCAVSGMGKLSVYDRCARRDRPAWRGIAAFREEDWPPLSQNEISPVVDVEDHNMILMQLENGVQASYLQCHYTPDAERNYTFIGDAGRLENYGDSGDCRILVWNTRTGREKPDIVYHLRGEQAGHGGADPLTVAAFVEFVRYDRAPRVSPLAARNAVAVGVLAHESMRSDGGLRRIPRAASYLEEYFNNGQKK